MHVGAAPAAAGSSTSAGKRTARRLIQLAALFGGAGRLDWIRGWIDVALTVAGLVVVTIIVHRCNPGLVKERINFREKEIKPFDTYFIGFLLVSKPLQLGVAGMDAVRFHWSSMPFAFVYLGTLVFIAAMALLAWTLSVNPFAESTVRIQKDRGQKVIESGPYAIVRHPMYVGMILQSVATPLILGSVWAFTVTGVLIVLIIVRTAWEDRTLFRELLGYEKYAARTRYRLMPGLW
jgi:protein-S-isoprenylcysteine O-methyltransferase Ste14